MALISHCIFKGFEGEKVLELLIKALDNTQVILLLTIIITTFLS